MPVRFSQGVNLAPYHIGPKLIRPRNGVSVKLLKTGRRSGHKLRPICRVCWLVEIEITKSNFPLIWVFVKYLKMYLILFKYTFSFVNFSFVNNFYRKILLQLVFHLIYFFYFAGIKTK